MNALFNSALRQSTSMRKDVARLADAGAPSPHQHAQLSASLTAFARTVDEYGRLARQEPVPAKQDKALDRLRQFRAELDEYRDTLARIKSAHDDVRAADARTELLGRRPHHAATPENPYALPTPTPPSHGPAAPYRPNAYSAGAHHAAADAREGRVLRETAFFKHTSDQLDDFLDRGRAVLGDLGDQREMLKGTQKRLYTAANTLGISGDTIRMVERRATQDKAIFAAGVVVFFLFCWLVLHYLR